MVRKKLIADIKQKMSSTEVVNKISRTFSVLSDSTRTRIIFALSRYELCVTELALLLGMSHSVVSHHLRALKDLDLVRCRKDGRRSYYSLVDKHIENLFKEGMRHVLEKL